MLKYPPWSRFCLMDHSINLRVTNSPSDDFDGTTNVTFGVDGMGISADRESSQRASLAEVNMSVTYFHCPAGKFWNSTNCELCTHADMNGDEVGPNGKARDDEEHCHYEVLDRGQIYGASVDLGASC